MKNTIILLVLCLGIVAISGCKKEPFTPDPTPPCPTKTWYEDADGDGLGNPDVKLESCDQPTGYVLDNTDPIDKNVERKQVPIMMKMSGETCPPCGGWGWTAWEELSGKFKGKAFCWTNYGTFVSNGNFRGQEITPTMQAMQDRFWKSNSKPSFVTGNTDYGTKPEEAETSANDFIAQQATVSAVLDTKFNGDELTLTAEVEFFDDMPGEYYLGAYVVEDQVVGYQSGHPDPNNASHHYVMRGSMSTTAWGLPLVNTGALSGDKFIKTFTANIPTSFNRENLSYGVVIWKKVGLTYIFVNAYTTQK